jgi:hypothetical protein
MANVQNIEEGGEVRQISNQCLPKSPNSKIHLEGQLPWDHGQMPQNHTCEIEESPESSRADQTFPSVMKKLTKNGALG